MTESKLTLSQHDRPRNSDRLVTFFGHQGIVTFLGKSADRGDGGLVSQRNILHKLEFRFLLC